MAASTRVPPEVLEIIFMNLRPIGEDEPLDHLSREIYRFTGLSLGRCALVCRTWLEPVRTVLYVGICLHDVGQNINLLRSLEANPSLAGLVKNFKLAETYEQPKTKIISSGGRPQCLSKLLSMIKPSLHTLHIEDAQFLQEGEFINTSLREVTLGSNDEVNEQVAVNHASYLPSDLQILHIRHIYTESSEEYKWRPLATPPKLNEACHFRCLTTLSITSVLSENKLLCFMEHSSQSLRKLYVIPDPYVRASSSILPYIPKLENLTMVLGSARNQAILTPDDLTCLSSTITSLTLLGVNEAHFPTIKQLVYLLTDITYLPNMQDLPYISCFWFVSRAPVLPWQRHEGVALDLAIERVLQRFASSWEHDAEAYRDDYCFWRSDIIALAAAKDQ